MPPLLFESQPRPTRVLAAQTLPKHWRTAGLRQAGLRFSIAWRHADASALNRDVPETLDSARQARPAGPGDSEEALC